MVQTKRKLLEKNGNQVSRLVNLRMDDKAVEARYKEQLERQAEKELNEKVFGDTEMSKYLTKKQPVLDRLHR